MPPTKKKERAGTAVRWDNISVNPLHVGPRAGHEKPADDMSCRRWDDIEDLKILRSTDDAMLSVQLGRTAKAIQARRRQLEKEES